MKPWEEYQQTSSQGNAPWLEYQQAPAPVLTFQEQPKPQGSMLGRALKGIASGIEETGLGIYQTAADLGAGGLIKKGLSAIRPDLAKDFEEMTDEDISQVFAEKAAQKRQQAEEGGTAYQVGRFGAKIAPFLAGGTSALSLLGGGALASGTELSEETGLKNRLQQAAIGAGTSLVGGKALQGIGQLAKGGGALGKTIIQGTKARPVDKLDEVANAIKQKSSALYQTMRDSGATLTPQATGKIVTGIEKKIVETGKLNARLHGDTLGVLDDIKQAAKSGKLGLEELDQYRQLLGDVVSKNTDVAGKANPDAMKATQAINQLDDVIENARPEFLIGSGSKEGVQFLNEARQEWKRYRKFDAITNILRKADGDANKIKSGLTQFINKPKNLRGFSQAEKDALKDAATNTTSEKLLKTFGKFGFDLGGSATPGNTFLPAVTSFAGFGGVPGSVPAVVGGTIARQAQKLAAKGKVEDVLKLIEGLEPAVKTEVIQKLPKGQQTKILKDILTRAASIGVAQSI